MGTKIYSSTVKLSPVATVVSAPFLALVAASVAVVVVPAVVLATIVRGPPETMKEKKDRTLEELKHHLTLSWGNEAEHDRVFIELQTEFREALQAYNAQPWYKKLS